MKRVAIEKMHCPLCGFSLRTLVVVDGDPEIIKNGILECRCRRYPVVEGILVLHADNPAGLQRALREMAVGHQTVALRALLDEGALSARIINAAVSRKLVFSRTLQTMRDMVCARRIDRIMRAPCFAEAINACVRGGYGDYFKTRLSSASFIAGIALLELMRDFSGPILEFGAGVGTHAFVMGLLFPERPLTLTDHSFTNLYLAKRFIAPHAEYVCLDGNYPLPFEDGAFQGVFSSDSFHYIDAKVSAVGEIKRVLRKDHIAVFSHLHNRFGDDVAQGMSLSGGEWKRVLSFSHTRLISEKVVFERFYNENALDVTVDHSESGEATNAFCLVASDNQEVFRSYGNIGDPYFSLKGRLGIHAAFIQARTGTGESCYRKQWPSALLQQENALFDAQLPSSFCISTVALKALQRADEDVCFLPEIQQLLRKFLVIHIPQCF